MRKDNRLLIEVNRLMATQEVITFKCGHVVSDTLNNWRVSSTAASSHPRLMATTRRHGQQRLCAVIATTSPSGMMPDRLGSSHPFSLYALFKFAYGNLNRVIEP